VKNELQAFKIKPNSLSTVIVYDMRLATRFLSMELRIHDKTMALQRSQSCASDWDFVGFVIELSMKPSLFLALRAIFMARFQVR